jgi:hypothetical protein
VVPHQLDKPLSVYGVFTIRKGTAHLPHWRSGALTQQLRRGPDRRPSTVWLLKADPGQDFTGTLESVTLTRSELPQEREVVMTEGGGRP